MTLVELAKHYKNKTLDIIDIQKQIQNIRIFKPIEEDDEIIYTIGNGNSWLEVKLYSGLSSKEIIEFRKILI